MRGKLVPQISEGDTAESFAAEVRSTVLGVLASADEPKTIREIQRLVIDARPQALASNVRDQLETLIVEGLVAVVQMGKRFELSRLGLRLTASPMEQRP